MGHLGSVLSLLCCPFQALPAPQEALGQPASPTSHPQGAPTASQSLLKLFQGNMPIEDLGAKGVSPERGSITEGTITGLGGLPACDCAFTPPRAGADPGQCHPHGPQASAGRPMCLPPDGGACSAQWGLSP